MQWFFLFQPKQKEQESLQWWPNLHEEMRWASLNQRKSQLWKVHAGPDIPPGTRYPSTNLTGATLPREAGRYYESHFKDQVTEV